MLPRAMSDSLDLEFAVTYRHRIFFTEGAFASGNRVLADLFAGAKVIPIVDAGLAQSRPGRRLRQGHGRALHPGPARAHRR
jgi:hypothetical protein